MTRSSRLGDILSAVAVDHNELWWPSAAKLGDISSVVAVDHNELWRPSAAKVSVMITIRDDMVTVRISIFAA